MEQETKQQTTILSEIMLTIEEVKNLTEVMESDRIEWTTSTEEKKLGQAICAFSNDFSSRRLPGYILIGVNDHGKIASMTIDDRILQKLGAIRSDGNILPQPVIVVSDVYTFSEGDVVYIEVQPSEFPPVRYKGQCWIRIGPRKAIANETEEKLLIEKRISGAKNFDMQPNLESSIEDLDLTAFRLVYQPNAVDPETIVANNRSLEQQLASLRFYDQKSKLPTNAGLLTLGYNTTFFFPGAYLQFLKYDGVEVSSSPKDQKFSGPLISLLQNLDDFIKTNIVLKKPVDDGTMRDEYYENYPYRALRELVLNAIMHRNYESNSPVYINEFDDRIEISNPGGLFGEVSPENFPDASSYRNPVISEVMRVLGYVNKYNFGIRFANQLLEKNGNGHAEFMINDPRRFSVTIKKSKIWLES